MFPLLGYASSMIGGDLVMDIVDRLMEDIGCYLASHSTVRELPYWGIFPLSAGSRAVFQVVG